MTGATPREAGAVCPQDAHEPHRDTGDVGRARRSHGRRLLASFALLCAVGRRPPAQAIRSGGAESPHQRCGGYRRGSPELAVSRSSGAGGDLPAARWGGVGTNGPHGAFRRRGYERHCAWWPVWRSRCPRGSGCQGVTELVACVASVVKRAWAPVSSRRRAGWGCSPATARRPPAACRRRRSRTQQVQSAGVHEGDARQIEVQGLAAQRDHERGLGQLATGLKVCLSRHGDRGAVGVLLCRHGEVVHRFAPRSGVEPITPSGEDGVEHAVGPRRAERDNPYRAPATGMTSAARGQDGPTPERRPDTPVGRVCGFSEGRRPSSRLPLIVWRQAWMEGEGVSGASSAASWQAVERARIGRGPTWRS